MSRNSEKKFGIVPISQMERSKWEDKSGHITAFNVGDIIPIYVNTDIMPGQTIKMETAAVLRLSTPIYPTMDVLYLDYYWFFDPHRLEWEHWKAFNGENEDGAWTQDVEYEVPKMNAPAGGAATGTVMDYMGIPIGIPGIDFNALAFRAYTRIYNEWFRDQNLIAPAPRHRDDTTRTASNTDPWLGGKPFKAAKQHDYFTSGLPQPQKGAAVSMPLGTSAPVKTGTENLGMFPATPTIIKTTTGANPAQNVTLGAGNATTGYSLGAGPTGTAYTDRYVFTNLYADLTEATAATINALRLSTQIQRILEKDARGGTRYVEIIKNHFGVVSPDARQQIPEYLGGKQHPFGVYQVPQTESTNSTSPQGNLAGFGHMEFREHSFTKSFTEHGTLICLAVARHKHKYQQGLARMWKRRRRFDFYWPTLAHIGEQPRYMYEIYVQGNSQDNEVFMYQEAWAEYRYTPSRTSGVMRSTYSAPLDAWHYGDKYDSKPIYSQAFIEETPLYVDRTLAVKSNIQPQIIADFGFRFENVAPMPMYSVPGLMDHF